MSHAAAAPSTRKLMKMAEAAMQKHRGQEAMDLLEQVVAINPHHAEAWYKIGFLLHASANAARARECYERAIQEAPTHFESYMMLCTILESENRGMDALKLASHAALNVAPNKAEAHVNLVSIMLGQRQSHLVVDYLQSVLPRFPNNQELHQLYCMGLKILGRSEEAEAEYQKVHQKWRVPVTFQIGYDLYMPRINQSVEEIDQLRDGIFKTLDRLIAQKSPAKLAMLNYLPVFAFAYHNRDNKLLLQRYHQMLRTVAPELNYTAPHVKQPRADGPIRIAFVSAHMFNHSVGSCYRSVMIHLAKQPEFEVRFFNYNHAVDSGVNQILDAEVSMRVLPKNLQAAREVVEEFKPDIMVYPDIGMHVNTQYLAMSRLAKFQCCFQGHPETTGIDTIDYVISSRSYEPPHADENYTERLLCNEGIDTTFKRPTAPQNWLTRQELGLPEGKKLYVCPMAIQKFHPDYDIVLAGIQKRDPNAVLVLFRDFDQLGASDQLQERILQHCDPERTIFMGWQPLDVLFSIMKQADALLDTIYFGGGTTAQYAFGFGFPIVTMPGRYARGRVIHSYYQIMGVENPPEADSLEGYVEMAVKVANDIDYHRNLNEQILAKNEKLFEKANYGANVVQLMKDIVAQDIEKYRR